MKLFILCLLCGISQAAEWSYAGENGVEYWPNRKDTMCDLREQSPIDIPWDLEYTNFEAFSMTGYDNMQASGLKVKNNGHTAQIDILSDKQSSTRLTGGGLNGTYYAAQLHFHWGRNDHEGSEHTFRGQKYPLEMHIVHWKSEYGTISDALKQRDGLAVLGFFFTTEEAGDNENLKPLIDSLDNIAFKDQNAAITIDFDDLMPTTHSHYYRYMGSLTTPECNQIVVWTVFENLNTISSAQLQKFRELYENKANEQRHHIAWNYRPTQELLGRKVHKNFQEDVPSSWHWGYEGTEGAHYWKNYYQTCSGNQQSPINIPEVTDMTKTKFEASKNLDTLEFTNYDINIDGEIHNNGHTVQIDISNGYSGNIGLKKGGLMGDYTVGQLHFHWGHDGSEGSEHTIENMAYPLEMHIVHYKTEYRSITGAVPKPDGLAVIGVVFKTDAKIVNPNYSKIIDKLPDVKYKNARSQITGFTLRELISDNLRLNETNGLHIPFYRYMGGLTTPPCAEVVTWTVMKNPVYITPEQLAVFRSISHITSGPIGSHDIIKKNYRPVQNLADRIVYQSGNFKDLMDVDAASSLIPSMLTIGAFLFTVFLL